MKLLSLLALISLSCFTTAILIPTRKLELRNDNSPPESLAERHTIELWVEESHFVPKLSVDEASPTRKGVTKVTKPRPKLGVEESSPVRKGLTKVIDSGLGYVQARK